ncbi:hypothetical protein HPB51_009848 [Rhipicephalus microplus]|uniref:UBC core domain-containing protein n=1 Tax=Rhipicephalus microplus TaxID=6941 RepID=A0A9J6ESY9_RHIMP|nr:hypothetical protein HPB51_009848 [Rhipicephalus microplus]
MEIYRSVWHDARSVEIAASDAASDPDVDVAKVDEALEAVATVEAVVKESEESLPRVVSEAASEQNSKGQGPDRFGESKLHLRWLREIKLLTSSLPDGIHVKAFEDRMDLYSVLIKGPRRTPYEDGLFLFDFQLPAEYPQSPPQCHYVSYCSDRLNPNLYDGRQSLRQPPGNMERQGKWGPLLVTHSCQLRVFLSWIQIMMDVQVNVSFIRNSSLLQVPRFHTGVGWRHTNVMVDVTGAPRAVVGGLRFARASEMVCARHVSKPHARHLEATRFVFVPLRLGGTISKEVFSSIQQMELCRKRRDFQILINVVYARTAHNCLILVSEPYYNEAGYEQQRGCQHASENSRMYNEMVVLKLVQSMGRMILNPPEVFREEIEQHFRDNADRFVNRLEGWLRLSDAWHTSCPGSQATPETLKAFAKQGDYGVAGSSAFPDFPLLPASRGFCLTLRKALTGFKEILRSQGLGCLAEISQGQSH